MCCVVRTGMGFCSQQFIAPAVNTDSKYYSNGTPGMPNGGNYQDAFPVFPADAVGTNCSLTGAVSVLNSTAVHTYIHTYIHTIIQS